MKIQVSFILTIFITFFSASCKKGSVSPKNTTNILGKWNIINDSTFAGVGANNHPVNYAGQTGDYFDLRTDNRIYIKEGTKLDTLSYSLISDATILIVPFGIRLNGVPEKSYITNLTAHSATISAPVGATPGGLFGRKINLNR
ncbi:MAG: hypothetical protein V5804_11045 [Mucilaginibacter sp.]|uniref:hypothetical protein n=1 Tax=Mucilaginibacter sp. TaxID=1882438 RepID=UPI0034E599DC